MRHCWTKTVNTPISNIKWDHFVGADQPSGADLPLDNADTDLFHLNGPILLKTIRSMVGFVESFVAILTKTMLCNYNHIHVLIHSSTNIMPYRIREY